MPKVKVIFECIVEANKQDIDFFKQASRDTPYDFMDSFRWSALEYGDGEIVAIKIESIE